MILHVLEYGTNKELDRTEIAPYNIPAVGEFFINDTYALAGWEDKMYIIRAVTRFIGDNVAIHVEKHNPTEEAKKWETVLDKLEELKEKVK